MPLMVIEMLAVIVAPALSVICKAKLNVPDVVGVPEMTPELSASPPGSAPVAIDQV